MEHVHQAWMRSKFFRVALTATLVYTALRLVVQAVLLAVMLSPGLLGSEMPAWVGSQGPVLPDDLRIYLEAARRFQARQALYPQGALERMEFYQYAPSYALAFTPFVWLPPALTVIVHTLLHLVAYGLLYAGWGRIFRRWGLDRAGEMLAWTLPVWLLFTTFWNDLAYLNVYIIMALFATLLIEAVLEERLGWSLVWLSIILQVKPQWAFAVAVPLLLGRYRFFFKLIAGAMAAYSAIVGVTVLAAGWSYGWQQHVDYARLLASINSNNYPWRIPGAPFLGYNQSITQAVVYVLGATPDAFRLATSIRAALLIPLAIVIWRCLRHPAGRMGRAVPQLGLDLAFALYLGVYIWMNVVWELSLGIAVFTYLLATLERRGERILTGAVFLPYALVDAWRMITLAIWGMDVVAPGPYVLTDPIIYIPLIMIVTIVFYALVVKRLWSVQR